MALKLSLRQRNRLQAMQLVQTTAVAMFETEGFEPTTIEAIAEACGVSPSTIYRHFGTKERTVLWDERDSIIDDELRRRLGNQTAVDAFRDAAIAALATRDDRALFLRRLKLTYTEPAIWAAAAQQDRIDRTELAAGIASSERRETTTLGDDCTAAVCLATLDIALDHWQQADAAIELADLIMRAFSAAAALE
ncbi:MAG: TetR/AcrR family transcriptional regulator [Actinobacteria bacterium]|nr:TetR/AcrR family transcriptional regulator [Actinomycetota bacterium]